MDYRSDFEIDFSARQPSADIDPMFYQRWSPRAFKKIEIDPRDLTTIMEAARWAPSSFNEQPWRIYTSTKASFDRFLELLVEKNQAWAKQASVLGFVVSKRTFSKNDKPNRCCQLDAGSAWMSLTLQARLLGLYTHGMAGVNFDQVYDAFNIDPAQFEVLCGFAIGALADEEQMSAEQQANEKPNSRKPLTDIWIEI